MVSWFRVKGKVKRPLGPVFIPGDGRVEAVGPAGKVADDADRCLEEEPEGSDGWERRAAEVGELDGQGRDVGNGDIGGISRGAQGAFF